MKKCVLRFKLDSGSALYCGTEVIDNAGYTATKQCYFAPQTRSKKHNNNKLNSNLSIPEILLSNWTGKFINNKYIFLLFLLGIISIKVPLPVQQCN